MKNVLLSIFSLFLFTGTANAQFDSTATNYITITGNYKSGEGIELRWFPSNRSIMTLGLENGYVIERALVPSSPSGTLEYKVIRKVMPYNTTKWNSAIALKNVAGISNNLPDMAGDFANTVVSRSNGSIAIQPKADDLKALKHEEDNEHGSLMLTAVQDKETALGLGIGMTDSTVVVGNTYMYRAKVNKPIKKAVVGGKAMISSSTVKGKSIKAKMSEMEIISMETIVATTATPAPINSSVKIKEGDGMLAISWDEQPDLVGYYVERSTSPQGGYEPLNNAPLLQVRGAKFHGIKRGGFQDETVKNERKYYYRISANTLFGDKILVANVAGTPKDLTPPNPPHLDQPIHNENKVDLEWKFLTQPSSDLNGFKVYRSDNPKDGFQLLTNNVLPPQARTFSDASYSEKGTNYYKVEAFDNNGNMSASLPAYAVIIDDTPPAKPDGIQANISGSGEVQIVIPRQKDEDIVGYKIFKANQADHEFVVVHEYFPNAVDPEKALQYQERMAKTFPKDDQAANTINPENLKSYEQYQRENRNENELGLKDKYVFTEKIPLNNLTPNIYYKVKTYDRNHNSSVYSETFEIAKPDEVAPPRSVFKSLKTSLNTVDITYAKAKAKDFNRVELSRRSLDNQRWQVIHTAKGNRNKEDYINYRDHKIEPGRQYIYRLQTIDNNGLKSPFAFSNAIKTINRIKVADINKLSAQRNDDEVLVSWNYEQSNEFYFIIYRTFGDGTLRQVGRSNVPSYIDKRAPKGQLSYAVKPMRKDGNRGKMSEMVIVK